MTKCIAHVLGAVVLDPDFILNIKIRPPMADLCRPPKFGNGDDGIFVHVMHADQLLLVLHEGWGGRFADVPERSICDRAKILRGGLGTRLGVLCKFRSIDESDDVLGGRSDKAACQIISDGVRGRRRTHFSLIRWMTVSYGLRTYAPVS